MTPPTNLDTAPQPSGQQGQPQRHDEELITFLEHEQLVSDRSMAVPPAPLSGRAKAALWILRVFALIVSFMVIYTFVIQLH
jgi:hypothetical protein